MPPRPTRTPPRRTRLPPADLLPVALAIAIGGAGCGRDPILDRADALDAGGPPGDPAAGQAPVQAPAPAPAPPPGPGVLGVAPEPTPGVPDAPPPGQPPGAAPGGPQAPLTGEVRLPAGAKGRVHVDVFDGDQQAAAGASGARPSVVGMVRLDGPGPFSVEVPAGTAQAWIGAFADEDGDGRPGPTEPTVWYSGNPLQVGDGVSGIVLTLERRPPPPGG